jgi:nitroreductase
MSTLETIASRYTCRNYLATAVPQTVLDNIALAGVQSPSSTNQQQWRIVVLTNPELIEQLDRAALEVLASDAKYERYYNMILKRGGKVLYGAPAIFVVAMPTESVQGVTARDLKSFDRDAGIAVQNMALAATAQGYASCICGLAGLPFTGSKAAELRQALQFPEGYDFSIALLVGEPAADAINEPHQPDLGKVITVN